MSYLLHKLSFLRRSESGQAALEFMLMIPFFMIFFFMIIDFGVTMYGYVSVANAAREGARYGATNCGGTCTAELIQDRTIARSGGFVSARTEVTVSWPDGRTRKSPIAVAVSHDHDLMFFPGITWTIKSCAEMPLEQGETGAATGSGC